MSTQILTELPNIQKAGMDFNSVMAEIRSIISNNPNWKENWGEFYNSEAGVMLTQLMAWVADNMSTRQDLLFNEMFLGTAQKDENKVRHLKQIGYIPQMPHSAKTKIKITLNKMANSDIIISSETPKGEPLNKRLSEIASFQGKDINGKTCDWEIIKLKDGKPDYLGGIFLPSGSIEYTEDLSGDALFAIQGRTVYEEFKSTTEDGSYFDLKNKNIAADSLRVYLTKTVEELVQVNSFMSKEALYEGEGSTIPYVLELNEDMTYRIRFADKGLLKDSKLLPANTTISVFYRINNGALGNIKPGVINKETEYKDNNGINYSATIYNEYPGTGGSNQETLDQAVKNGPISLRSMDRAVTPEDYNVILERNTSVFKTKTYTASNQPKDFRNYYGRFINPQESFSFIMLNKDHNNIPSSKFNSFPWVTTIREPRLNEKYIFDKADYNHETIVSPINYNITVNRENNKQEFFRNLTVIELGDEFNDSMFEKDEAGNFLVGENNEYIENSKLKLKLSTKKTNADFFDDIPFSIFNENDKLSVIKMKENKDDPDGMDVNLIMDDNARFLSKQTFDETKPINVKSYRYLTVVLNDGISAKVDLLSQMNEDNPPSSYYLKWDNSGTSDAKEKYGSDDSIEAAEERAGIVNLINKAITNVVSSEGKFKDFAEKSFQYFGFTGITNPDDIENIPTMNGENVDYSVLMEIKGEVYRFDFDLTSNPNTSSPRGSLNYLRDSLNYAFSNGETSSKGTDERPVMKYNKSDGSWNKIGRFDLEGYEAVVRQREIFNSDRFDDKDYIDDSIGSGIVKLVYDIAISNKNKTGVSVLTNYDYIDVYGYEHYLKNVVDIQDPFLSTQGYEGIFKRVLESTKPFNRKDPSHMLEEPTQKATYEGIATMSVVDGSSGTKKMHRLCLKSPTKGSSSTIYFRRSDPGEGDFMKDFLKLYFDGNYSYKAYGVKKIHLLKKAPLSMRTTIKGENRIIDINAKRGNILFENSCIYTEPDFDTLYANYALNSNNYLKIGSSYENYYYVGGEKDNALKSDNEVVGIMGQYMDYEMTEAGTRKYNINLNRSNFNIKFSKEPQDTNSIFAIKDDLGVIGVEKVKVVSYDINKQEGANLSNELIFSIDEEPEILTNIRFCNNAKDIIESIKKVVKNGGVSMNNIKENINTIVSTPFESINQIKFQNINNNGENGNVKFYASKNYTQEQTNNLYKMLLGTNKTNTSFYNLYPPTDDFANNIVYEKGSDTTNGIYYYAPQKGEGKELTFTFRKMVEDKDGNLISRPADYFIDVETRNVNGVSKYDFYLKKTENSRFPDSFFYLHFVNDKTYDFLDQNNNIKETDESVLQNYMKKYKISGTDIIFLQPYFKTYDIAASIKYNPNLYNKTEISKNVKSAIDSICNLENSEIAGSISRAKIFKAIMNCDGVEDCRITYLGYDYSSNREDNAEELIADFYEVICLHEDDNITNLHGKILTFDEVF